MKQDFYKIHAKRSGDVLEQLWLRVPGACEYVTNLLTNEEQLQKDDDDYDNKDNMEILNETQEQQPQQTTSSTNDHTPVRHRKKRKTNDESSIPIV